MRIGLISDTHGHMDDRILHHFSFADEIWHAGDIGDLKVTDALEEIAPVRGVYGNIDGDKIRRTFPLHNRFMAEDVDVWMTHIGGRPGRYSNGIREELAVHPPKLFICGHSHILRVEMDKKYQCLYINPGAAGIHGFHKMRTMIRFDIFGSQIKNLEVIELGSRT